MTNRITLVMLALSLASQALAGFKISKKTYRMDQLESAQSEAESKGKPITFVYTSAESTCPLCAAASLNVISELDSKSVVVYVDAKADWGKLPKLIQEATRQPEAGKFIPKTVVADSAMTNVIAIVPCAHGAEQAKFLREAKKAIFNAAPKEQRAPPPTLLERFGKSDDPVIRPDENREMRTWKAKMGAEVKASLVKEIGGSIFLKKENGETITILLKNLTEADQEYIAKLKNAQQQDAHPDTK